MSTPSPLSVIRQLFASASPLEGGEAGEYAKLAKRPLPEGFVLVFIPSLAALLMRAQQLNGSGLTEAQVLRIRDASQVMVVPDGAARAMEAQRGYVDIDAADAWQSWLVLAGDQA